MLPNQNSRLAGSIVAKHLAGMHDQSSHGRGNPNYPRVKDKPAADNRDPAAIGKAIELRGEHSKTDSARTELLSGLAAKNGGQMEGLEYRLKDTDSLARKIQADSQDKGISLDEAASSIYDVSRYTMVFDNDNFSESTQNVLSDLEADGFTVVQVKNTLKDRNAQYRGVNVKVEKDGVKSEVQFHTPESTSAKKKNHEIYSVFREETNPQRARAMDAEMVANSAQIPTPPGIDALG